MSFLEWLLIFELVLLGTGTISYLVGSTMARENPDDAMFIFCRAFWRGFFTETSFASRFGGRAPSRSQLDDDDEDDEDGTDEVWQEKDLSDSFYGRIKRTPDGKIRVAKFWVKVIAEADANAVDGRVGETLRVKVVSPTVGVQANKVVLQVLGDALGIKAYQLKIVKGHYKAKKLLKVAGIGQSELEGKIESL